jgi:hypothetical protein
MILMNLSHIIQPNRCMGIAQKRGQCAKQPKENSDFVAVALPMMTNVAVKMALLQAAERHSDEKTCVSAKKALVHQELAETQPPTLSVPAHKMAAELASIPHVISTQN